MVSSILLFILVLSVLVLVHELGHFFVAKRAGVLVEEFGFGIPPRVFGKKFGETIYSVNLLPFGGFVRLHGESGESEIKSPKRAFLNKSKKTRILIVTAGVIMNFLLGILLFSIVYSFLGIPRETENVRVIEIASDSPAEESNLAVDDVVEKVGGRVITSTEQFIQAVEMKKGETLMLTVLRGDNVEEVEVVPRKDPPEGQGALGVVISTAETYFPPIWQRPFIGMYYGLREALFWGSFLVAGFIHIFGQLFKGILPREVAGPVGIFALTSQAASFGFLTLINFVGVLSINLAILNIIPFPALDGGRLLFIVIETFLGKKVVPKVEAAIHTVGMVILLLLVLAITLYDIQRLISAGGLRGFVDSVIPQ